jgi:hypothetical protein
MERPHDGHELRYVYVAYVSVRAELTEEGDVKTTGDILPDETEHYQAKEDPYVYCLTCEQQIYAGEDGLSSEWTGV